MERGRRWASELAKEPLLFCFVLLITYRVCPLVWIGYMSAMYGKWRAMGIRVSKRAVAVLFSSVARYRRAHVSHLIA